MPIRKPDIRELKTKVELKVIYNQNRGDANGDYAINESPLRTSAIDNIVTNLRNAANSIDRKKEGHLMLFFKRIAYKKGRGAAITATARK